jgi:HPt (histidine-containing phosphotransfer) domain-containing protein
MTLYDLTILKMNSNNDSAFIHEMIQLFKQNGTASIQTLSKNCIDGASQDWVEAAHLLKGGAGMIGAERLKTLAATAQNADSATAEDRLKMYNEIKDVYTKTCDDLIRDGFLKA